RIWVRYYILNLRTLKHYYSAFRNDSQASGQGSRSLSSMLLREIIRKLVFNAATVPVVWLPLLATAEHNQMVASRLKPSYYRNVVHYHFLKGVHESSM